MASRAAVVLTDSYAGRREQKVWVVGETPKRYRVSPRCGLLVIPPYRIVDWCETVLVPKTAIRFVTRKDGTT